MSELGPFKMHFESPDMAKDFPGLYATQSQEGENPCKYSILRDIMITSWCQTTAVIPLLLFSPVRLNILICWFYGIICHVNSDPWVPSCFLSQQ